MKTLNKLTILILLVALLAACAKATEPPPTETPVEPTEAPAEPTKAPAEPTKEPTKEPAVELGEAPVDENNIYATIADYEAATGNSIASFGESPMLADMVESGDLPPVEERLPSDLAVVRPKVIGQYGGEIRLIGYFEGAGAFSGFTEDMEQGLFLLHESLQDPPAFHPNVAKDWELAEDAMSITIYLREGMKWSDGDDFNADDFAFGFEILQDEELTIEISGAWKPGGELMGLNVIDDYTVQYTFAVPYWRAIEVFSTGDDLYKPEHFLKQYIPRYNDGAEALAEEEAFESWQAAADFHGGINDSSYDRDPMAPQLNPWIIKEISPESILWERNPYFWRVDAAGNQLPYVDTLLVINTTDVSAITPMKVMAGEVDWNDYIGLSLADYPTLKEKEEGGAYNAHLWPKTEESHAMGFALNYIHPDPVLREIFNDIRFRYALSLAINRDEISENLFYGLSEPWTAPVSAIWTGYEDWMGTHYAEHDVEQANALLDEMGLEWDDAHEYRLRSDGEELFFPAEYCTEWLAYSEDLMDLVSLHWKDIGVHMEPKFVTEETLQTAFVANETNVGCSNSDGGAEIDPGRTDYPIRLIPPWHWGWDDCCAMSGYQWRVWLDCDRDVDCNQEDVDGIEPPDDIKRAYQLAYEWLDTAAGSPEYKQKIGELITLNVENFWYFGTVTPPPSINIRSHRLGNAEGEGGPNAGLHHYFGEAYFLRE